MRSRSGKGSDAGSGSESDARSSSRKRSGGSKGGDGGKVRRQDNKSLVQTGWTLIKQVFFTIVHIYKSLTAFWSQMHVCMLPALGELDHEQEQQEQETQQEDTAAAPGSPGQRKRSAKVN